METLVSKFIAVLVTGVLTLPAQTLQQEHAVLDDQRVVTLSKSLSSGELVSLVMSAPDVSFDLSPASMDAMMKAGVSEAVIKAMAARANGKPATIPSVPAIQPVAATPAALTVTTPEKPASEKANDTVTVTSLPDGAKVEWNRKVIGTTPLTYKVGEYAFNARKVSLFSKRLEQPVVLRVSKEGFITREVTVTKPLVWRSFNGKNQFAYFVITSNSFQIDLDKISAVHAALTNDDVFRLKASGFGDDFIIDKINNSPAAFKLELDDLVELHKAGISDAVLQAMMHAK